MTDCVVHSSSPWFVGPYGHVYSNPIEFKKPIPFKGALKFFDVPVPDGKKNCTWINF